MLNSAYRLALILLRQKPCVSRPSEARAGTQGRQIVNLAICTGSRLFARSARSAGTRKASDAVMLWICRRLCLRLPAFLCQLIACLFKDAAKLRLFLFGDPGQIDIEDAERLRQEREHQLEIVLPALLAQLRNETPSLGFEVDDKRGEECVTEHAAQLGGVEVAQRRTMIGVGIEAAGPSGHEACSDVGAVRSAGRQSCLMIAVAEDVARETLRARGAAD